MPVLSRNPEIYPADQVECFSSSTEETLRSEANVECLATTEEHPLWWIFSTVAGRAKALRRCLLKFEISFYGALIERTHRFSEGRMRSPHPLFRRYALLKESVEQWRRALARIFHQFLLRRRKLVCRQRYVSDRDSPHVSNTLPVASLTGLATHQLATSRDKTGEISGLTANGTFQAGKILAPNSLKAGLQQIHRLTLTNTPVSPESHIQSGARVRIKHGPLMGLEGGLLQCNRGNCLLVNVEFFQRRAAVALDGFQIDYST